MAALTWCTWNVFDPRVIRWRLDESDRTEQLLSLSELRRGIEPVAAALAAERANGHHCRILAAAVSDMVVHGREGDLDAYLLADTIFHRTLLEASGNEMLRALDGVVEEVLSGRTHHGMMPQRPNPEAIALHDEVARAVRLGDAPRPHRRAGDARDHRGGCRGAAGRADRPAGRRLTRGLSTGSTGAGWRAPRRRAGC